MLLTVFASPIVLSPCECSKTVVETTDTKANVHLSGVNVYMVVLMGDLFQLVLHQNEKKMFVLYDLL